MLKRTLLFSLIFSILFINSFSFADNVVIKTRQDYIVKEGDTLWDISNRFLAKPWLWKEIWKENPDIEDPNYIYPDDIISIEKIDGNEYIVLKRNSNLEEYQLTEENYIKKTPEKNESRLSNSIGLISKDRLKNYFSNNLIIDMIDEKEQGFVLKSASGSLISGSNDEIFVTYKNIKPGQIFNIYNRVIEHKDTKEDFTLGYEIVKIGEGIVTAVSEGDVGLMKILSTKTGIRNKYKIMLKEKEELGNMFPSKPIEKVVGNIISIGENIDNLGLYDIILIDKGYSSNLEIGNILSIKNKNTILKNPLKEDGELTLPGQQIGLVMLYKVYDNLSYGVIVKAKSPVKKEYIVTNPE